MFNLDVYAYPDSKGDFFYEYPFSTKRLDVSYQVQQVEDDLDYAWKIDLIFKLTIPDEQKKIESRPTLFCDFWTDVALCFGKEPIAQDHFLDIDPDFPSELLGHLKGVGLIDISAKVKANKEGIKPICLHSRYLEKLV